MQLGVKANPFMEIVITIKERNSISFWDTKGFRNVIKLTYILTFLFMKIVTALPKTSSSV